MMILSADDLDNVPDGEEQSVINEILKMKVPNFKSKFKISKFMGILILYNNENKRVCHDV